MFETGGLALPPKMDGAVGKCCVDAAKIEEFVAAAIYDSFLPSFFLAHQMGKCTMKKTRNRYFFKGDDDK